MPSKKSKVEEVVEEEREVVVDETAVKPEPKIDVLAGATFEGKVIVRSYDKTINGKVVKEVYLSDKTTAIYE